MQEILKTIVMALLSLFIVAGFFYNSYFIMSGQAHTSDSQMLLLMGTVNGAMAALSGQVCSYWFGSSKSSGDKDKAVNDSLAKIPTATITATKTETPPKDNP